MQEAQHAQNKFVCLGAAEIRSGTEKGTFRLSVRHLSPGKWCPTPNCRSAEVEGVKLMGPPTIVTDLSGVERDLLLHPYRGRCPECHVARLGGFGNYMDGINPTVPGVVWLFNAGRLSRPS